MTQDVSRETTARLAADRVFGGRLPQAESYVAMLATTGVERGLIGPREVGRLWSRHILNCAVVADLIPLSATVCDVGSGAGLPGIVWAIQRPDIKMTLVEPLLRRSKFLIEAVEELELTNTKVLRRRAEELHGAVSADIVTARAVAPLDRLATWIVPLVTPGGTALAFKGASAGEELATADHVLDRLGIAERTIEYVGAGMVEPPTTIIRLIKARGL